MMKMFGRGKRGAGGRVGTDTGSNKVSEADFLNSHPAVVHADPTQMDAETRALYRDAKEAAEDRAEAEAENKLRTREFVVKSPFQLGFTVTLGVLVAVLLGHIIDQLSTIIMYIVAALFISLGLDPIVRWFERKGVNRAGGIALVFGGVLLVLGGLLAIIIPMIARQVTLLADTAPRLFWDITNQEWYQSLNERFGEYIDFEGLLHTAQDFVSKPDHLAQFAGGVWQAGVGLANGLTATLIVLILTLYFLASLGTIKRAFYSMVPRTGRAKVIDITEQVTHSVGGYVNGMVILAFINAVLGFIMMLIVGVPFSGLIAVGVFFLALIPLIGSVVATVLVGIVALFESPMTAVFAVAYYLVYMQIESYVLTPRIMNRVVSVPGALVVIGALVGGTLLGLLGALISIPVTATVLMIIKQVWIPRQELR